MTNIVKVLFGLQKKPPEILEEKTVEEVKQPPQTEEYRYNLELSKRRVKGGEEE